MIAGTLGRGALAITAAGGRARAGALIPTAQADGAARTGTRTTCSALAIAATGGAARTGTLITGALAGRALAVATAAGGRARAGSVIAGALASRALAIAAARGTARAGALIAGTLGRGALAITTAAGGRARTSALITGALAVGPLAIGAARGGARTSALITGTLPGRALTAVVVRCTLAVDNSLCTVAARPSLLAGLAIIAAGDRTLTGGIGGILITGMLTGSRGLAVIDPCLLACLGAGAAYVALNAITRAGMLIRLTVARRLRGDICSATRCAAAVPKTELQIYRL
jgi:hypothetical protein